LRELPTEVTALAAVAFMVAVGFGVVAPAIPLFARHFGVSKASASAVISAFAFARLIAAPFTGRLVNAFGERTMLAIGIGIVSVSSFLAGLAGDYWQLLVLRGVGGVGSIMFSVSSASLLIRVTPNHLRGRCARRSSCTRARSSSPGRSPWAHCATASWRLVPPRAVRPWRCAPRCVTAPTWPR
jgi:MFS family permease